MLHRTGAPVPPFLLCKGGCDGEDDADPAHPAQDSNFFRRNVVLSFQEDAIGIRLREVIGVGPAVFLFRYYTAVRCTVSVACVA
jgi:hypothetical protein